MLAQALTDFPTSDDPRVLMGVDVADDAGVYLLHEDLALVQTVDFFTPIVDDPYAFGQIAAANSLSDVYCMGANPITALNIIAFPEGDEPGMNVLQQILRGGFDKAAEAGVAILGGHSVDDPEPKYGMAVTGIVHPKKIWSKKGARVGDRLVLTKPLGTGILATAVKKGSPKPEWVDALIRTASTLNRAGAEAAKPFNVHAATDITGFGLVNHLYEICKPSNVGAEISFGALPVLEGVPELIEADMIPGGTRTNLNFAAGFLEVETILSEVARLIASDAQTSGGILFAVPADQVDEFTAALAERGALAHAVIGEIFETDRPVVRLNS